MVAIEEDMEGGRLSGSGSELEDIESRWQIVRKARGVAVEKLQARDRLEEW